MNYKKSNRKYLRPLIVATLVAIPILGVIFDIGISLKQIPILVKIEDLREFSLVLIQIQVTIVTLTLSIIGILSAFIPNIYMGVLISSYYLENNRFYITEKWKTIINFSLLVLSLIGYIVSAYNFVTSIFILSFILILVSILDLYEVFKGRKHVEDKIKDFINNNFKNTENTEKNVELAQQFVVHWNSIILSQTTEEFEQYSAVFWNIILFLFHHKKIRDINWQTQSIALSLLQSESKFCKLKGLLFVNDVYQKIRFWIDEDRSSAKEINQPIELMDKISTAWYYALCSLDDEIVKVTFEEYFWNEVKTYNYREDIGLVNEFQWFDYYTKTMIYVHSYISPHGKQFDTIMNLASKLGEYIAKQKVRRYELDYNYWSLIITKGYDYSEYFSKKDTKAQEIYINYLILRDFNICFSYLMNGQTQMVLKGLFSGDVGSDTYYYGPQLKKLALVHCLMYYIVHQGRMHGISKEIREKINQLMTSFEFEDKVIIWYVSLNEHKNLFSELKILDYVKGVLGKYKLFSKNIKLDDKNIIKKFFKEVKMNIEKKKKHDY